MKNKKKYEVIVIGAGHAGCEAALASARLGCQTLLITLERDKIGLMSCNPAIGGVGKGQLVKEIDALGGEMGRAADACGIQFRILNASKGPAVWSSRAQIDSKRYSLYMQQIVSGEPNLELLEAEVIRLMAKDSLITGVEDGKGGILTAKAIIITPGTFLNGLIHIGMKSFPGGRIEEKQSASMLSDSLRNLGFRTFRFKTGTCARLDGESIDFSGLSIQQGDDYPKPFSFSTKNLTLRQVNCFITYTNDKTHDIIRRNLKRSPLFSGKITGTGVRYCPSLEDKVVKFPHHPRHQIFLEPEGLDTNEFYPNGLSTSLPEGVQEDFIHSIAGLENAKINRFGYGIEHDVIDSTQLYATLQTKLCRNLFLAGQVNGTTGYEEAAAQGLIAGINAARMVKNSPLLVLDRSGSYIGVLIDDLVTKGTPEPYRMFTSRVEYRLLLREDNADLRLRKTGFETGLVSREEYEKVLKKQESVDSALKYLQENRIVNNGKKISLYQFLKRPEIKIEDFKAELPLKACADIFPLIEAEVKYSGFIKRQLADVRNFRNLEKIKIPANLDYQNIYGLSCEIKEKLSSFKPFNLGQASRISGVTPVAISILMIHFKKLKIKDKKYPPQASCRRQIRLRRGPSTAENIKDEGRQRKVL
ncbi:MAG: tRNA uridine-5-carboxymethylaminomethyl(34) synthesis enzyme MnmG [Candidatus Omnitrophica bacterium]|nr:tRNA uridine-5-carboxymethylaminomethyl(34) synthesis enzyme MnmG [Candidatus Omnitrophota bacterium]